MEVVEVSGTTLGRLDEVLVTGANDVFVVKTVDGGEELLPVIETVVKKVDLENGIITVERPEWD
jgi:16S rRNA processing protein RimM